MPGRLADKVIVVTGASGIAAAGAKRFATEGGLPIVISLEEEECRALAKEITGYGGRCGWVAADLRHEEEAVAAFDSARDITGRIDGLFAVAGASGRSLGDGPVHGLSLEAWVGTFEINGHPMFLALREAVRAMREGSGGSAVIVSSVLATHPSPRFFATHAYAAVKGAALAFARSVASYYVAEGIRVNVVSPGLVDTPMAKRAAADPEIEAYAASKQPLADGLLPAGSVASAALYLLSDEARHVTGQLLEVDGGWGVTEVGAIV